MAGGRKPLPTQLKLVKGTLRKDRQNKHEPIVAATLTGVPEHLSPKQKQLWADLIQYTPPGLLKQLDASVFEIYIVALDQYRDASERVRELGQVVRQGPSQYAQISPYLSIMNKQAAIMLKAASEMGFTPASRTKIAVTPESPADDPWSKLAERVATLSE